jgi:hypothetical protein
MLPLHEVDEFLQYAPPELRDIVLELRNLVAEIAPGATEWMRPKHGLTYFFAGRGGPVSAGICQISLHDDHVRLHFNHGAFLPDPEGLLEGERKAKRFLRLNSFEHAPWEALKDLIAASAAFDPYTLQL